MNKKKQFNDKDYLINCCICGSDHIFLEKYNNRFQVVCKTCTTSTSHQFDTGLEALIEWTKMCRFYKKYILVQE